MRRDLNDPLALAPANLAMIKVHFVTGIGLITAYIIELYRF
jgi:hypothetical protein